MKILLDTCEFLWLVSGDVRLSPELIAELRDPKNELFLSVVSVWEIFVKHGIGKLTLPQAPGIFVRQQREAHKIVSLELNEAAVNELHTLPDLHRDPFDRMLICQAKAHGLSLASSDALVRQYSVALL